MNEPELLEKTERFDAQVSRALDGLPYGASPRHRISGALLHLSLEHFSSILLLVRHKLHHGSAYALVRPQFETLIRGMWVYSCATEQQVEEFCSGSEPPKIKQMINAIESLPGIENDALTKIHKRTWNAMNSYTHGGTEQVLLRLTETEITSNFSPKDITNLLRSAAAIALSASCQAAVQSGNLEVASGLIAAFRQEFQ